MSIWTTKADGIDRDYILIKHKLPNVNYNIGSVRFRGGYCVVEKGSKTYYNLKKTPLLRNAAEYPITFLRKLPFITRTADIKMIFGQDVLSKFLVEEKKLLETEAKASHLNDNIKCRYVTKSGELCKHDLIEVSPSGYCHLHILLDPELTRLGIEVPQFIPKAEKNDFRQTVINKLSKMSKAKLFNKAE